MSRFRRPARVVAASCLMGAVLLLAACGHGAPESPSRTSITLMVTPSAPGAWRSSMGETAAGLERRLQAEVDVRPVSKPEDAQDVLLACGRREQDLVVCLGAECGTAVFTVAPIYPTTRFLVIPGVRHERNVAAATFEIDEAAYVAGAGFSALDPVLEIRVLDRTACPEGFISALEAGVRSRGVESLLISPGAETPPRTPGSPASETSPASADRADLLVCCGQGRTDDEGVVTSATVMLALDSCLAEALPTRTVATVDVDLQEAIARIAEDLLGRSEPGRAFAFDLGSGVVDLRISESKATPLPPAVRREMAAARDEVVAGIAEIESLGM